MEAFTIICETCAAKLKVRNASLVGQKLACPKCGAMVLIEAPEGWVAPAPKKPDVEASGSSETDFEDIDSILKQQPAPKKSQQSKPGSNPEQKPLLDPKRPTAGQAPILPDENWIADSTKSTRKWITIVAVSLGALVLVTTGLLALYANQPKKNDVAAVNNADSKQVSPPDELKDDTPVAAPPVTDAEPTETKLPDTNLPTAKEQPVEAVDSAVTEVSETPEAMEAPTKSPLPTPPDEPTIDAAAAEAPKPKKTSASPFDEVFDEILNSGDGKVKSVQTNFDELSDALENAGTTLSDLNQFASVKRQNVGLPKYFVDRNPLQRPPKKSLGLDLPCAAVRYQVQSLNNIIADIEQITGTPISLDANQLQRIGFDFGSKIEQLLLKDPDSFANVVRSVFGSLNDKTQLLHDGGIQPAIITASDSTEVSQRSWPLPNLKGMNPEDLAALLRDLIAPGTWGKENKIELANGELKASHSPATLFMLETFLKKWEAAIENPGDSTDAFRSIYASSLNARQQSVDTKFKYATPIREFFAAVEKRAGVNILIDFESLSKEGWSPRSTIPAGVSEDTVNELLDEICHSMKIDFRLINDNTFELLTAPAEKQRRDLEFYDCKKILAGPLQTSQLIELLRQSLQSAGFGTNDMRAFFANEIECFIVVAPQSIQRKVEKILQRLAEL